PPQVAARTLRPTTLHPVVPSPAKSEPAPAKSEPSRITAHILRAEEPPPPAPLTKPSQVAVRTRHPLAPPPATKSEPLETGAHVLRPAVLAQVKPGSPQVAPRARQHVPNLAGQEARRGSLKERQ